jgi:hypothetical protein
MNESSGVGIIIGMVVMFTILFVITDTFPRNITSVNKELIKHNMAYHDPKTGNVVWIEGKNDE